MLKHLLVTMCVCVSEKHVILCVIWSMESIYQGQKDPKVSETNGRGPILTLPRCDHPQKLIRNNE